MDFMKLTKTGLKSKPEISIENYLMKEMILKENMEEIDIGICQNMLKIIVKKRKLSFSIFSSFFCIR